MLNSYDGERLAEEVEVVLADGRVFMVTATLGYNSDYEPETGNGWDEPREGGYFNVGIDVVSLTAVGEDELEVQDPILLREITTKFLEENQSTIEDDIAEELADNADDREPPERDDYYED